MQNMFKEKSIYNKLPIDSHGNVLSVPPHLAATGMMGESLNFVLERVALIFLVIFWIEASRVSVESKSTLFNITIM